ncbi:hypothetical protein [uncultured Bacteroides sp.]|uniref:hypothetical protein n=1 Tax=uncultured Bacteroides sp. TaxID=162156 RepID=UPI002AA5F743|nr:hypothetical protein [uncultured Bacteroides sp.]
MKFIKTTIVLLFFVTNVFAQNNFKIGLDYLNKGNYALADSFLTLHLKKYPGDNNALFNKGTAELNLQDTCSFCNTMYKMNKIFEFDRQALDLYYSHCGYTDTIYYDNKFVLSDKTNFRYYEVIGHHKYFDFITGKIHDNKGKTNITSFNLSNIETKTTDIIAIYRIMNNDSIKTYSVTDTPPKYPKGPDALHENIRNSRFYTLAKKNLNLPEVTVDVEFIVDKNGKTNAFKIISTRPQIEIKEDLNKYISLIFKTLPDYIPGKFNGKNVDFEMFESIRF